MRYIIIVGLLGCLACVMGPTQEEYRFHPCELCHAPRFAIHFRLPRRPPLMRVCGPCYNRLNYVRSLQEAVLYEIEHYNTRQLRHIDTIEK